MVQFHPADGVDMGRDFTIYSLIDGIVVFRKNKYIKKVRPTTLTSRVALHAFDNVCLPWG
jgi:ribosomal protein L27